MFVFNIYLIHVQIDFRFGLQVARRLKKTKRSRKKKQQQQMEP